MPLDPTGFAKVKYVLTDSVGSVYPGMEGFLSGTWDQSDLDDLATTLLTDITAAIAPLMDSRWLFEHVWVIVSDGSTTLKGTSTGSTSGSLGGTRSGSRDDCVVSGYQIGDYYRGGKPRTYWPGPWRFASGSITHWDVALIGDFEAAIQDYLDGVAGATVGTGTFVPGCIRRVSGGSPLSPPQFFPYLGSHTDARICTQRRRLGRL